MNLPQEFIERMIGQLGQEEFNSFEKASTSPGVSPTKALPFKFQPVVIIVGEPVSCP